MNDLLVWTLLNSGARPAMAALHWSSMTRGARESHAPELPDSPGGSRQSLRTAANRYCVYDESRRDYLYTDAWVRKLVRDLRVLATFETVPGTRLDPWSRRPALDLDRPPRSYALHRG